MANTSFPVSVVISAVDKITAPLARINASIKAAGAGFDDFKKPLGDVAFAGKYLANELGMGKMGSALSAVGGALSDVGKEAAKAGALLVGIGGAAALGTFKLVESVGKQGDHVARLSARLGMTTDQYQALAFAAKNTEIEQEQFDRAMTKLSDNMVQAVKGPGAQRQLFEALGVSLVDANGKMRTVGQIVPEVADKLKGLKNENIKTSIAQELFGAKAAEMVNLLRDGSVGLQEQAEMAKRLGVVLDSEAIKKSQAFDDAMDTLHGTLEGLKNTIGVELLPVVVDLMKQFATFIQENRAQIGQWAAEYTKAIPGIAQAVVDIGKVIFPVIKGVVSAVQMLASIFGNAATGIGIFALTIGKGLTAAIISAIPVIVDFGIALLTTPIGWFMLAVAGIATVVYQIYKHWGNLGGWFKSLWGDLVSIFSEHAVLIAGIVLGPFGAAIAWLIKNWSQVGEFFSDLWSGITDTFTSGVDAISGVLTSIADKVKAVFGGISDVVTGALSVLPESIQAKLGINAQGAAVGAGPIIQSANPMNQPPQQAEVKVRFDNLPPGVRIDSSTSEGLNFELSQGLAMVMP